MNMKTQKSPLLPSLQKQLSLFGESLRLARLRRELTASLVAERAGISRQTLLAIEKGAPSVSIGAYASVLLSLGLEKELGQFLAEDKLGRVLQDSRMKKATL